MARPVGHSPNDDQARRLLYRERFVRRVHELLLAGAARADMNAYHSIAELEITGLLVAAIREVTEDPASPPWMSHFAIHDDPPIQSKGRFGKKRPRVDIEFERTQRGAHPRFQFEAKRLRSGASARAYLGPCGLGCFLSGKYAREMRDGGMLGYVQHGDLTDWAQTLEDALTAERRTYRMCRDGHWRQTQLTPLAATIYCTRHRRGRSAITIYHTLLRCV